MTGSQTLSKMVDEVWMIRGLVQDELNKRRAAAWRTKLRFLRDDLTGIVPKVNYLPFGNVAQSDAVGAACGLGPLK